MVPFSQKTILFHFNSLISLTYLTISQKQYEKKMSDNCFDLAINWGANLLTIKPEIINVI